MNLVSKLFGIPIPKNNKKDGEDDVNAIAIEDDTITA
jgi:hypothetical protein